MNSNSKTNVKAQMELIFFFPWPPPKTKGNNASEI